MEKKFETLLFILLLNIVFNFPINGNRFLNYLDEHLITKYYDHKILLSEYLYENAVEEQVDQIKDNIIKLISNLIELSVYYASDPNNPPNSPELIEETKICRESYSIFSVNSTDEKAKRYYLLLLYYDSSRGKNDIGSYTDCMESQTLSYKNLNITDEEKRKYQEDSTYMVLQYNEKKKCSFADLAYHQNEYLVGLCVKKGCSENSMKKIVIELNKQIQFFDNFNYDEIEAYDIDSDKINKTIYIYCWIPIFILIIIFLFSCLKCIPNLLFSRLNPRRFNELKECFNLKKNHIEIFGNYQENENIVSNDTGLSIIKGLRGLNMITVLMSTSFFYIYHLPTKIYNKESFNNFLTSAWFIFAYFGQRFGTKILYALSGYELIYKMLNYLDNCIENKEKLSNLKEEQEEFIKEYNITNEIDDCEFENKNTKKIYNNNMLSMKEFLGNEEEDEEKEEKEDDSEEKLLDKNIELKNKSRKKSLKKLKNKINNKLKRISSLSSDDNYLWDFDKIDLANDATIEKLDSINKVIYKRHRSELENRILFNFIFKQWHRYIMFILAIFFYKYAVIKPLLVFKEPCPMWLIHLRKISNKFKFLHIVSNIFCFSPFSYATYNEIDPFGMAYNEIVFFIIGSILIFFSYKHCLRLDWISIFLALFFFVVKIGIGCFFFFTNDKDKNYDFENEKKNHGFYPLMFYQYNEDNCRIKSFFLSNQIFNITCFLLGILFGEMNYSLQNFSKANDKNKLYLGIAKKALNHFSRMKKKKVIYLFFYFSLFILCIFIYHICIAKAGVKDPNDFFLNSWYNLLALIDTDIGVVFYFISIVILLLCGDNILVRFLKNKYWGVFSRTYWTFLLCFHICTNYIFYLSENRIKLIFYNVLFFSFEILMVVIIVDGFIFVCVEIPFKKLNKIFIKNQDEKFLGYKNK